MAQPPFNREVPKKTTSFGWTGKVRVSSLKLSLSLLSSYPQQLLTVFFLKNDYTYPRIKNRNPFCSTLLQAGPGWKQRAPRLTAAALGVLKCIMQQRERNHNRNHPPLPPDMAAKVERSR